MRTICSINDNWKFCKTSEIPTAFPAAWEDVTLPHTWNAVDGQDGGDDYWRGQAVYCRMITEDLPEGMRLYAEFPACGNSGDVYLGGEHLVHHDGGYSTFRADLTDGIRQGRRLLAVKADNSVNDTVYPQAADFTFYGGLYRGVNLIAVPETHFELIKAGSRGLKITPVCRGTDYEVTVETWQNGGTVEITVNGETKTTESTDGHAEAVFVIKDAHLWDGVKDPYLYTCKAVLKVNGEAVDEVCDRFGCRTFEIDPDKGFLLNGRSYPLRGVSRHQDRKGYGNALTDAMHEEDMDIICEMGANSIRLAHYQHAQKFYDLCDERGLVAWAEIPFISAYMENGEKNTFEQMEDLITQNYNHACVAVWGLSNEITMRGMKPGLVENHVKLNDFVHRMDPTRPTTMAHVSMLDKASSFLDISDVGAYNLYFGWYDEGLEKNDQFLEDTHRLHPSLPIGLTEYGCDTNPRFHSENPVRGDYTEEYQMLYHEYMLNMFMQRPWIWCTYAWNMFDFAADARNEGGTPGTNQKGLVTMDRKIRKDAYYLYKAYWSDQKFVHLCGRRFVDHNAHDITLTVYSNLPEVTLYKDGVKLETKTGERIFRFNVSLEGEHTFTAESGTYTDSITIRYVSEPNQDYIHKGAGILNWFDAEGLQTDHWSLVDRVCDMMKSAEARNALKVVLDRASGDEDALITAARKDISVLENCELKGEELLDLCGKTMNNNIKRFVNAALQKIKK